MPVVRFHDIRQAFAPQLAASGVPLRALQEFRPSWRWAGRRAANDPDASRLQATYELLREEALQLNRRGDWASDELMASLLPTLGAIDEIAELEVAYATGADPQAGLGDASDPGRVEALLRDLAAWATGVCAACEFIEEARGGD